MVSTEICSANVMSERFVCKKCNTQSDRDSLKANLFLCKICGSYFRIPARDRIDMIADAGSFNELWADMRLDNPLSFPGYEEKLENAERQSGLKEAVLTGTCRIGGIATCIYVMDSAYIMASMGVVVGEKITRLFEYAMDKHLPVVGFTASGGARMQEGMLSLIQMAKVSGIIKLHSDMGLFYIVGMTDPTTGGVEASFAQLGDVIFAEKRALIGFAGKRIIEATTGAKLPEDFQIAEKQLENGFIDNIVEREDQKAYIGNMLKIHCRNR